MKSKKEKVIKEEEIPLTLPLVEIDHVNIQFSNEDLKEFREILSVAAQTMEYLAKQAASSNDEKSFNIFLERFNSMKTFYSKIDVFSKIGEPISREIH